MPFVCRSNPKNDGLYGKVSELKGAETASESLTPNLVSPPQTPDDRKNFNQRRLVTMRSGDVKAIRSTYLPGMVIVLSEMVGEPQMESGLEGIVRFVDDIG